MIGNSRLRPRTPRDVTLLALPIVAAALVTGCPSPHDDPAREPPREEVPSPPESAEPAPPGPASPNGVALDGTCTNPEYGFTVDHPADWEVNEANGLPPCSAFDPDDVSMPEAGEVPVDIAVVIKREPVPYERVTDFEGDFSVSPVSVQETTVAGRRAVAAELEHTGQGLYPDGHRHFAYYIDLGSSTVIAATHRVEGASVPPYRERKRILDAMVGTLRIEDR